MVSKSLIFLALVFVAYFHFNFCYAEKDRSPGSYSQAFISEDGVYNSRARVLGGGSVINAGFYSHAEADFLKQAGLNEALVNHSYQWVETKVAFKPPMLQWQSALRNGLLEAGVLPDNGFTHDHVHGTKVGGTIFDTGGHKHTAADLLEKQSAFLTKDSKSEVISSAGTVTDVERCWSRPPTRGGDGPSRGGPRDGC
ncbi:hypothetical protein QUC31_008075 [Theobroma cacao]